jgi:hypothetical protein
MQGAMTTNDVLLVTGITLKEEETAEGVDG